MSAVFAEGDQVVPMCRHPLLVVVRDQDLAVGIPQFGSDDAQRQDNVRFQVFDKQDAPPVEQRRVEPQAVVRMSFPRQNHKVTSRLLVRGFCLVIGIQFFIQKFLFRLCYIR